MAINRALILGAGLGILLAAGGCISAVKNSTRGDTAEAATYRRALSEATIAQWSDVSALAARRVIEEYGTPDEVHYDRLVWNNDAPWRRTVVRNVLPPYSAGDELGVIEQTIDYSLTPEQAASVAAFDRRLAYNPRSQELSVRSDREENNFLRLNLANEVVEGKLSPDQARDSYARILALEEAGKSSRYLLGLRFAPGI